MQENHSKYYVRFALEVIALIYLGWWGGLLASGWWGFLSAMGILVVTMLLWGIFNVPGDPSRSGKAPVVVPGKLRLAIEAFVFLGATYAILIVSGWLFALLYLAAVIAHYIHTKSRVTWIVRK